MNLETLQVYRGDVDALGNVKKTPDHTIDGAFAWGNPRSAKFTGSAGRNLSAGDRKDAALLTAELYVPRDADVKQRDRLKRANGEFYQVVGHPTWDQLQAQTGHDFGYKVVQVEGAV